MSVFFFFFLINRHFWCSDYLVFRAKTPMYPVAPWPLWSSPTELSERLHPGLQFSSVAHSVQGPTLCDPRDRSTSGFPVHHLLPEIAQAHVHRGGDPFQPSHLLSSPSPPVFNLSRIRFFSNESDLHIRWPKYCSFSFNISPSSEHPGLTSFRIDWSDLLTIQGTLKSLLQHHSSKAPILQRSAFFTLQLSHPYMATGKTIAVNFVCQIKSDS